MRLARFLAASGIASRRRCEEYIRQGRVTVNGEVVSREATVVDPRIDVVHCDGQPVSTAAPLYVAINKPAGVTCSLHDTHASRLVSELLPKEFGRLFPVGRLDRDSEGLLLLTNDGALAQQVAHPSAMVAKTYMVNCRGSLPPSALTAMCSGIRHEGEVLKARSAELLESHADRHVLRLTLIQGRKREIRRMCSCLGLDVERLVRVKIGNLELGDLAPGRWRRLTKTDILALLG